MTNIDWKERAAKLFCFAAMIIGAYAAVKYLLPVTAPFICAFAVAAAVYAASSAISRRTGIPRKLCAVVTLTALLALLGFLVFYAARQMISEIAELVGRLTADSSTFLAPAFELIEQIPLLSDIVSDSEEYAGKEIQTLMLRALSSLGNTLTSFIAGVLKATPSALITGVVSIASCYYMSVDLDKICAFICSLLPNGANAELDRIKKSAFKVLAGYLRAYGILFVLTFVEVLVGLFIICPSYAWLGALAIAAVDILPVFGAGFILIPWGLFSLIGGDVFMGIGLLVLYVIVTVVRQIAEPHIIGENIGVSPLVAIISTFIGYRLFGFLGMLSAPILSAVAIRLLKLKSSGEKMTDEK